MVKSITNNFTYRWLTGNEIRLPIDKTRIVLIFLAINYFIVAIDVTIAHALNRFFPVYEWIPIIYCPLAVLAILLLLANPTDGWPKIIFLTLMVTGIIVGILGFGFHLQGAAAGNTVSYSGLINSNPVFAPLAFIALGSIGLVTVMDDHPQLNHYALNQKTRYLLIVTALWFILTAVISFFDHARTNFTNIYTWIPLYIGIFAGFVFFLQAYSVPSPGLCGLFETTLALSLIVGLLGFAFHLSTDLAGRGSIIWSRIFYQAPGLAPLLFCDLALWGALVFLDPITTRDSPMAATTDS